jgi:hypothetical protein
MLFIELMYVRSSCTEIVWSWLKATVVSTSIIMVFFRRRLSPPSQHATKPITPLLRLRDRYVAALGSLLLLVFNLVLVGLNPSERGLREIVIVVLTVVPTVC